MDEDTQDFTGAVQTDDFQEIKWQEYLLWCRANQANPKLSDFLVWLQDYDEDTKEW